MGIMGFYPPVNGGLMGFDLPSSKRLQHTMEKHHVQWVNPRFLWDIFDSYVTNYGRVAISKL